MMGGDACSEAAGAPLGSQSIYTLAIQNNNKLLNAKKDVVKNSVYMKRGARNQPS